MNMDVIKDKLADFIAFFETENLWDFVVNLDANSFLILVGVTALLVLLCLIRKMVKTATLIVTICAITVLLHFTVPAQGERIELSQLLGLFIGGTFIVAVAIWFIFIRTD
jgi:hypothetical protein